jgi:ParB family chromosome partitioning protein
LPARISLNDEGDLEAAVEAMKNVTWTALEELKGDCDILKKIADAEALLQSLRKALSGLICGTRG